MKQMDREQAIDILYGMKADNLNLDDLYTKDKYDALEMAIEALEQEPKKGRWIDTGSGQMCSRCGEIQYGYDSFRRFCASCGIRMVEP